MAKKRQHHEEHENHERWLVSYADFITLLFAFFVVMYSVSRVDQKRMTEASQSIKWALHYEGTGGVAQMPIFEGPPSEGGCAVNIGTGAAVTQQQKAAVEQLRRRLERRLKPFLMEKTQTAGVIVVGEGRRLTVRLSAAHFFDAGGAVLRPEVLPVLDSIGDELQAMNKPIRAEGNTDDAPLSNPRFRNNWDLSASRAAAVAGYLEQAHHIDPKLLSATGFASSRPIAGNETPEGREANRRIDLTIEVDQGDPLNLASR